MPALSLRSVRDVVLLLALRGRTPVGRGRLLPGEPG